MNDLYPDPPPDPNGPRPGDRVLTVRDPWAFLIVTGAKPVENRTWATPYRGPIWIHAAKGFDDEDFDWCRANGVETPDPADLPHGIVGRVELIDCMPAYRLPRHLRRHWSVSGPVCWLVSKPIRLSTPVACPGKLGVWRFAG